MPLENHAKKRKILLVEDDDSMRRFLEIVLRRADFDVVTAEDGLAAMEVAFGNGIDAVVSDAVMPNLTGYDLCRLLRQNPEMKNVPLIILSGLEREVSETPNEFQADAYLLKSNRLSEELITKLTELLNKES